jgi:5-methylcytosine-specific restriction endonuclease McrA
MKNKIPEQPKLCVELIPTTCHYSNIRTTVKAKEWDKIRFISYANADNKCEICNQTGLEQGYKHKIECHEIWHYDDKKQTQRLAGLISLCPLCHLVKHIGRAFAIGKQAEVFQQLELINNWTHKEVVEHVANAFIINKKRSKHQWILDLKLLMSPPYEINTKPKPKRVFKRKFKYRKKRKSTKK